MPFALEEIRKFGREGHRVFAADTFSTAPGSRSRYVEKRLRTPSPRHDTRAFVECVLDLVARHEIELVVPSFEEVFYLAPHRDAFAAAGAPLFTSSFDTLLQLHDKASFAMLARRLDIPVAETRIAHSRAALRQAAEYFGEFLARPAFSRGGIKIVTNCGPMAGEFGFDDVEPSATQPWVVQEFLDGDELCTLSIAHEGRIAAHAAYVHPREIEHGGGIVFHSIEHEEAFEYAQRIVEVLGYTGQIHFDFLMTPKGLRIVECNPRASNGVTVMDDATFVEAVLCGADGVPDAPAKAPAGVERKVSIALIRDMLLHPTEALEDLEYLMSSARDVYVDRDDLWPGIFQVLSYSHVAAYRLRRLGRNSDAKRSLVAAYFDDIEFNGADDTGAPRQRQAA